MISFDKKLLTCNLGGAIHSDRDFHVMRLHGNVEQFSKVFLEFI